MSFIRDGILSLGSLNLSTPITEDEFNLRIGICAVVQDLRTVSDDFTEGGQHLVLFSCPLSKFRVVLFLTLRENVFDKAYDSNAQVGWDSFFW